MNWKILTAALLLLTVGQAAHAGESDGERVAAIQERLFARFHEIDLSVGFIPDDDFYHAFPVGLAYTYNFNENVAWEVVRGQWVFNLEKDLRKDLEDQFGVTPSEFDKIQYLVHSNLVVKPSYGKDALWNRYVVNHETFLLAGVGVVGYERKHSYGGTGSEAALSLSFGLGRKYFLNESFCLNFEVRDLVNFKDEGVENNVYLGLGLGYRFDLAPRKSRDSRAVEDFRTRLEKSSHE